MTTGDIILTYFLLRGRQFAKHSEALSNEVVSERVGYDWHPVCLEWRPPRRR